MHFALHAFVDSIRTILGKFVKPASYKPPTAPQTNLENIEPFTTSPDRFKLREKKSLLRQFSATLPRPTEVNNKGENHKTYNRIFQHV